MSIEDYLFDPPTTLAILAGFTHNRRVMVTGYHGTGKSTHIEQVAARLNWPCVRVNLDSHISRIDLIGKDAIVLKEGKQITEFRDGILPWALQRLTALVFDEYDAGRADVMFVIQRIAGSLGRLTLLDQNKVISHTRFPAVATANTVASATRPASITARSRSIRARWAAGRSSCRCNYLAHDEEVDIVAAKSRPESAATPRGAPRLARWCVSPI